MSDAFLSLLCTHCAPTLSGVKPACIFTLHKENIPGWQTELSSCRSLFSGNGLRLRVLCGCRRHLVIMVYRPALLRESLRQPERRAFLQARGYPVSMGTGRLLDELSRRMRSAKAGGFPHEIGLFLGYPLEDVVGFIANNGCNYKYSGCWKVYGDEAYSRRLFAQYKSCKQQLSHALKSADGNLLNYLCTNSMIQDRRV